MASLNSLQMRALAAQTTAIRVLDDGPTALRIVHTGTSAVTSVTVTTGTNIVLIDAAGTTTVTFATDTTIGAVCDRINASANWKAKVLDALRANITTASNLVDGVLTANNKLGEMGYDVKLDTSTTFFYPVRLTYDRTAGNLLNVGGHRVKLVSFDYLLDVGTAAADKVRVYEWDPVLATETQIWSASSVDSTTTVTSYDFSKAPITAKEGNDLIVLVTDAASLTDASTNYLQAIYVRE